MKKKIEISKQGGEWIAHCLKTGKKLGAVTEAEVIEHWNSRTAVFVDEAMQEMCRRVMS